MVRAIHVYSVILLLFVMSIPTSGQKTALIIIDVQDFYFQGGNVPLVEPEVAGMNAGLLLEKFRNDGGFIVHVKHDVVSGGGIHDFVRPAAGERVVTKKNVNAFLGTGLKEILDENQIERVVMCGMQTHMCVEAAVRAASDMGYETVLISDACATRSLQYGAYIIDAEEVHLSTLASLRVYATIMTTSEYLMRKKTSGK